MRSPLWFVVAGVIAVAGFVAMGLYMMPRLMALDDLMTRVAVPGSAVVDLDRPGRYTIFHEQKGFVDGRYYELKLTEGLQVRLVDDATSAPVTLGAAIGTASYSLGEHQGVSILSFTVDHPGRYRLTASLDSGRTEPKAVLAIDRGMTTALFRLVMGSLLFAFGGIAVAGTIVGITIWQRTRTKT